jgi:peptidoglycan/xylan/chitin deacetylase (PgdA/CDA1 family)
MSRRKYVERILNIFLRVGMFDRARRFMPNMLTILNYHRVVDRVEDFAFQPNISADVASFTRQMEYLKRNYNVISSSRLAAWLRGEEELSPHTALITFDDGYSDNYSVAYPILKKYELPATIFLATNYMNNNSPFPWDYAAYCFFLTEKTSAHLPAVGFASWKDRADRERVMKRWVNRIKRFPDEERSRALKELSHLLGVVVPGNVFDGLYLTWDQVRALAGNGIAMGAHTASHPIMTSIPLQSARE